MPSMGTPMVTGRRVACGDPLGANTATLSYGAAETYKAAHDGG